MSNHGLSASVACLRRWSNAMGEGVPMPDDFEAWARVEGNTTAATMLRAKDEQLWLLLSNRAGGNLKAMALSGQLQPFADDPAEVQAAKDKAEIAALVLNNPFDPVKGSLTAQLRLAQLSPSTYARLKAEHADKRTPDQARDDAEMAALQDSRDRLRSIAWSTGSKLQA